MGYIDPGLFGIVSQLGLTILLILGSVFMFFLNPIKKLFSRIFRKGEQSNTDKGLSDESQQQ
jgi:hypothetical protein